MDKLDAAIARLQEAARMSQQIYEKPLMITYSGRKDSDVLLHQAVCCRDSWNLRRKTHE